MTRCRYTPGRVVPIAYNRHDGLRALQEGCFTIGLVAGGHAVILLDGERFQLVPHMLLCIEPGRILKILMEQDLEVFTVSFEPAFINRNLTYQEWRSPDYPRMCETMNYPCLDIFLTRSFTYSGLLFLTEKHRNRIGALLSDLAAQIRDQPDGLWSCRARSYLFLLLDAARIPYQQYVHHAVSDQLIMDILFYIDEHLSEAVAVQELSRSFHLNANSLGKRFKAATGKTITGYMADHRIELSKYSLAFTDLPIEEIARTLGFKEQSYFTKVFKAREGLSPLYYRKRMRAQRQEGRSVTRPAKA